MSITQSFPFTVPTNYTYDSAKVEITGGVAKLKDLRPTDATFAATFTSSINGNWGDGTLTGTATGGAAVSGGKLDLDGPSVKYVSYDADFNADMQQTGCVRFKVTPNYSGAPVGNRTFFSICKQSLSTHNILQLLHKAPGQIQLNIYDSTGGIIIAYTTAWVPVSGTEYEFEVNFDITAGATRIFVDGTQLGATQTATGTRDANIGLLRIGSNYNGVDSSDFKIDDFIIFSTVQHTADYTPGTAISETIYDITNPTVTINEVWMLEGLEGFTETSTKTGSDEIKYYLKKGTTKYYYNSGWVESDGTYAQSTTAADIETNKATFTTSPITFGVVLFLHSNDGATTPEIDLLAIDYDFAGETADTINTCIVWGYSKNPDNTVNTTQVKANINKTVVQYKDNITVDNTEITDTPDASTGYWELELIETANMSSTDDKYIFNIGGKEYEKSVPNEITKNFWDLT